MIFFFLLYYFVLEIDKSIHIFKKKLHILQSDWAQMVNEFQF